MINDLHQLFLNILHSAFATNMNTVEPTLEEQLPEIAMLAREQKLLPILLDAMANANALPVSAMANALKREARNQIVTQTIASSEQEALLSAFRKAGIPAFTVKGEVCAMTYPKPSLRISGDADILVPKNRFLEACNLLISEGFEAESESFEDEFEVAFHKNGGLLRVELHNSLFSPDDSAFNTPAFQFSAESEPEIYTAEDGFPFHSLQPLEHLRYLILHAYKHFIHSGFGLRQACDIALWARAYASRIDWDQLKTECEEAHCFKFAMAILCLCETELGIAGAIPEQWSGYTADYDPLLQDMLEGGIYGGTEMSRHHSASITLNAVNKERGQKKAERWRSLFPKYEQMSKAYEILKKHKILLPWAWGDRIVKYCKKVADSKGKNRIQDSLRIGSERIELLKYYDII